MKPDRLFYAAAGAMFLVLTVIGFQHYIFGGRHFDGTPIDPMMLAIVIAHSTAIFAWFVLFFVQSLLISVKNRKLHMKLGWSACDWFADRGDRTDCGLSLDTPGPEPSYF